MSALSNVSKLIRSLASTCNFNSIFAPIEVISADESSLRCRFQVTEKESNSLNTLHGGYTSSLIDFISSVDLLRRGVEKSVSVDLATSFMKAAPVGSWVQVDSRVLRSGKTLAFCEVSLHDEASGKLLAKGRHTKYILSGASSDSSSPSANTGKVSEEVPPGPKPSDNGDLLSSHVLLEVEGPKVKTRKRCRSCYEAIASQKGSSEARRKARKVSTFCGSCNGKPFLCASCFSLRHSPRV